MRQFLAIVHTDRPEINMFDSGATVNLHKQSTGARLQESRLAGPTVPSSTSLTGLGGAVTTSYGEQDLDAYIVDARGLI